MHIRRCGCVADVLTRKLLVTDLKHSGSVHNRGPGVTEEGATGRDHHGADFLSGLGDPIDQKSLLELTTRKCTLKDILSNKQLALPSTYDRGLTL
jgi:hypothetical protein